MMPFKSDVVQAHSHLDVVLPSRPDTSSQDKRGMGNGHTKNYLQDLLNSGASWHGTFAEFVKHCEGHGISGLPANTINLAFFESKLPECVAAGLVTQVDCDYIHRAYPTSQNPQRHARIMCWVPLAPREASLHRTTTHTCTSRF